MGAPHRRASHHDDTASDNHDDNHDDDNADRDYDADHLGDVSDVTHLADVHHADDPGAVPDPRATHTDPVTCAGALSGTRPGADGHARRSDAVTGAARLDGYTGVP